MTKFTIGFFLIALQFICDIAIAQRVTVTVAGNGIRDVGSDGHPAIQTKIKDPTEICSDAANNIYFVTNGTVRKLSAKYGTITTIAGGGTSILDGIPATDAPLGNTNICADQSGNIYLTWGSKVRKVDAVTHIITTVAGTTFSGYSGDGGPATNARFNGVISIGIDKMDNIYVEDAGNGRIRKINAATGIVTTIAGNGIGGYSGDGGLATLANLDFFRRYYNNIGINSSGDVFFIDQGNTSPYNTLIRKVSGSTGIISTVAGGGRAIFGFPGLKSDVATASGFCIDTGSNLYFNEISCSCRRFDTKTDTVYPVGGNFGIESFKDDTNSNYAWMAYQRGICVDKKNNVYIADNGNNRIRKLIQVTHTPLFAIGQGQSIEVCTNVSFPITRELSITDMDYAQPETWSILHAPLNGNLTGFPYTTSSLGPNNLLTPSGLSYTPYLGFSGADSFVIKVSDGFNSDTVTIFAKVSNMPAGSISTTTGPALCLYSVVPFFETITGGVWDVTNTNASITSTGLVFGAATGLDTIVYSVAYAGCTVADSFPVSIVAPLSAGTISGKDSVCIGSTIKLTESVSGGVWFTASPEAKVSSLFGDVTGYTRGTAAISYNMTNVCGTVSAVKMITVDSFPSAGIITGSGNVCSGASITLSDTILGGTWSASNGNATISAGGIVTGGVGGIDTISYAVTNVCGTATALKTVTVNPLPSIGLIAVDDTNLCVGQTVLLTNPVGGGMWTHINGSVTLSGSGMVTGYKPGKDTIYYAVVNSCGSSFVTQEIIVVDCISLGVDEIVNGINIYPTPAYAVLNIDWDKWEDRNIIVITDVAGREVFRKEVGNNGGIHTLHIDIDSLVPGLYFVKINDNAIKKFVKQ